ncbi:MAG: winged helix-turn-helix transcriptional regulator [Caldivirga sp.]|uniref:winged helix-turn-helix transcriptional regulator n=1 Tax=Caldivirga sp. TaxID=2080243 RepID=UPI003D141471
MSTDCPVTRAWRILGKPWRLVIIDRLREGPRSFNQLLHSMPGISSRTLSKALRELQSVGMITVINTEKGHLYALTDMGKDLDPIVNAVREWSNKWLSKTTNNEHG